MQCQAPLLFPKRCLFLIYTSGLFFLAAATVHKLCIFNRKVRRRYCGDVAARFDNHVLRTFLAT